MGTTYSNGFSSLSNFRIGELDFRLVVSFDTLASLAWNSFEALVTTPADAKKRKEKKGPFLGEALHCMRQVPLTLKI